MKSKNEIIKVYVSKLIEQATDSELLFKSILARNKIRYKFQHSILYGDTFIICDFYIHTIKMIIEIDGGYHSTKAQKVKDSERDNFLKQNGYNVERIRNEDVINYDIRNITRHFSNFKIIKHKKQPLLYKFDCEIIKEETKKRQKNLLSKREKLLRLQYPYLFK